MRIRCACQCELADVYNLQECKRRCGLCAASAASASASASDSIAAAAARGPPCAESAARFCRRHTHVFTLSLLRCAESAARSCRRHTQVSASAPPSCANSASRFCGRHTHVSAPSPQPCAESTAHTHVSASSPSPCAESAARFCERHTPPAIIIGCDAASAGAWAPGDPESGGPGDLPVTTTGHKKRP